MTTQWLETGPQEAASMLKKRSADVHKGDMGHAALLAGSYGMLGAAMLAATACMRCGVGKLTLFADDACYPMLQAAVPEAIFHVAPFSRWRNQVSACRYDAIGYGPGIGFPSAYESLLDALFASGAPLLIDADGINQLSHQGQEMLERLPGGTILTPHAGEYDRLFGGSTDPIEPASRWGITIVMKGSGCRVVGPDGIVYRNRSGNPGLATAGSGDVLSGMITGLLARGYDSVSAARLGVYLHGRAGDLAADQLGQESLMAGDLPDFIGTAYKELEDMVK